MAGWLRKVFGGSDDRPSGRSGGDTYESLRNRALFTRRSDVGIPAPPRDAPVWGVLMDMGFEQGTATLMALSDGTTSLYTSGGGGVIGGHAHERVRAANAEFLNAANRCRAHMAPTERFPLPGKGQVHFYALTDVGVLMASAEEESLGAGGHALSSLFLAGHGVITPLRETCDAKATGGPAREEDPNRVLDDTGLTLLMVAAYKGEAAAVGELIRRGAKIEARDANGYTPLMFACNAGRTGCVKSLVAARADVNARDATGSTPLMFAAQNAFNEIIGLLLAAGADPDVVGKHGLTAAGLAAQRDFTETIRLLAAHPRKGG